MEYCFDNETAVSRRRFLQSLSTMMILAGSTNCILSSCAKKKKVIVAQTITDMDHDTIAKSTITTIEDASKLGGAIEKGVVTELSLKAAEGYCVIVASDDIALMVLTGEDAASSVGLILRNLRVILEKL